MESILPPNNNPIAHSTPLVACNVPAPRFNGRVIEQPRIVIPLRPDPPNIQRLPQPVSQTTNHRRNRIKTMIAHSMQVPGFDAGIGQFIREFPASGDQRVEQCLLLMFGEQYRLTIAHPLDGFIEAGRITGENNAIFDIPPQITGSQLP